MGYYYRDKNQQIKCYYPDDTDNEFYISENASISEIIEKAKEKWPGISFDEINIEAKYIHTDCIGYDLYDPGDYTNYLKITKSNAKQNLDC